MRELGRLRPTFGVHTGVIEAEAILLEREREVTGLLDAVTAAQRGRGRVILVEAPAGLGKTSLLKVAAQAAGTTGFTCLRARASELERDFGYGCVRQLLEPVVAKAVGPERERLFQGAAALSRPLFGPTGASQPLSSVDSSFAMLHGLYWLLGNLADERPVALSVDDLHWADPESLRFLNYLSPGWTALHSWSSPPPAAVRQSWTWLGWRPVLRRRCCGRSR